jgi:hypothetical protein
VYEKIKFTCSLIVVCLIFNGAACSDYHENLGRGYTYMNEGKGNNFIYHEYPAKGGEIPRDVVSFDYDNYFIIAKQKRHLQQYGYETAEEYNKRNEDGVFYYWLIDKKNLKTIGPMDSLEFVQAKKDYNVSDKLKIN